MLDVSKAQKTLWLRLPRPPRPSSISSSPIAFAPILAVAPERAGGVPTTEEGGVPATGEEQEIAPAEPAGVAVQDASPAAEAAQWFGERGALPDPARCPPKGAPLSPLQ